MLRTYRNACENGGNFRRKNLKYTSPNDSGEVASDESGSKSIQESVDITKSVPESSLQFPDRSTGCLLKCEGRSQEGKPRESSHI